MYVRFALVSSISRVLNGAIDKLLDDTKTESVQYYTVRSKFTVSTLTCLDHLAVREDCECDVKACVVKVSNKKINIETTILPI